MRCVGGCDLIGEGLAHLGLSFAGAYDDGCLLGGGESVIVEDHEVIAGGSGGLRAPHNIHAGQIEGAPDAVECGIFENQLLAEVGGPLVFGQIHSHAELVVGATLEGMACVDVLCTAIRAPDFLRIIIEEDFPEVVACGIVEREGEIISLVISGRGRIDDAQIDAELHHTCAGGHIDRSVERDIGLRGRVVSNPRGLAASFRLEDSGGSRIRIGIDPAIEATERIAAGWENLEVSFVDPALGRLIKCEFDLAGGTIVAIHRDLVGYPCFRLECHRACVVRAKVVIGDHWHERGDGITGIDTQDGIEAATGRADCGGGGVGWCPFPPDGFRGGRSGVRRLPGFSSGLGIGAGHAGIISREGGATGKGIVRRAA